MNTTNRMRIAAFASLIVCGMGCAGCSPGERSAEVERRGALSAGPHQLTGTVFGGGSAMPGTVVDALADGTTTVVASSTADGGGGYALSLEDGTYDLRVAPPGGSGFGPQTLQNVTLAGADKREDIVLIAAGGVVAGQVRGHGGVGLGQTTIQILDAASGVQVASVTTDAAGHYQVSLGAGTYHFFLSPSSPLPAGAPSSWWSGYFYNLAVTGTATINLDLPVAKVSGVVSDGAGAPVPNAAVSASANGNGSSAFYFWATGSAQTDAGGHYDLIVLTGANTFTVAPPAPLGALVQSGVAVSGDMTRDFVAPAATTISGDVRGYAGVGLGQTNIQILDAASGVQVASVTTDAAGHYQVSLGAGTYHFFLSPSSPLPAGAPSSWWSGYFYNLAVTGTATINLDLPVAKVSGVVSDGAGAPVPNAAVSASANGNGSSAFYFWATGSAQTDAGGHYDLIVLTGANTFTVAPPAPLGALVQSGVAVSGDMTRDFVAPAATTISGDVRGYAGVGLGQTNIQILDAASGVQVASVATDAAGHYQVSLGAGTYHFFLSPSSPLPAGAPSSWWSGYFYNFAVTGTATINLDLPVAKITGIATDANGAPVPGVSISAGANGNGSSAFYFWGTGSAQTDAQGRYALIALIGNNTFTVTPPVGSGFSTTVLSNVSVPGDFAQRIVLQKPDLSPPIIVSGPSVVHLSDTSVSIRWQTNEPADSLVDYGVGGLGQSVSAAALVTNHEVTLVALEPSSLYQYRASSRDGSGNGPAQSPVLTFTTQAPPGDITPPVITGGPTVTGIGQDSAIVVWTTDEPASTVVHYGATNALGSDATIPGAFTPNHQLGLTGLAPDTTYFFRVESTDPDGNGPTLSPIASFKTAPLPDTTAPKITSGPEVIAIGETTLTVAWTTDEPATSGVSYNDGTEFFLITDGTLTTAHAVVLAGLATGTTYTITVSSSDGAGNGPTLGGPITATPVPNPRDTTPPVFTGPATGTKAFATCATGARVDYVPPPAVDAVDGPVAVACLPAPRSTFPLGATPVTCTAADAAGNTATTTFSVEVVFQAPTDGTFFLPPIDSDGSGKVKKGAALPVKFRLSGVSAGITDLRARLSLAPVTGGVPGTYQDAVARGGANSGNLFRYDRTGRLYIFDLDTRNLAPGVWSLKADLGDGVTHVVTVTVTR